MHTNCRLDSRQGFIYNVINLNKQIIVNHVLNFVVKRLIVRLNLSLKYIGNPPDSVDWQK